MTPQELKRLRKQATLANQVQRITPWTSPLPRLGRLPEFRWPLFVVRERPYDWSRDQ